MATIWFRTNYIKKGTEDIVRTIGSARNYNNNDLIIIFASLEDGEAKWLLESDFINDYEYLGN